MMAITPSYLEDHLSLVSVFSNHTYIVSPLLGCPRKLVHGWWVGYNLPINGIYWGYNPFANHLLTSWDIQVSRATFPFQMAPTEMISLAEATSGKSVSWLPRRLVATVAPGTQQNWHTRRGRDDFGRSKETQRFVLKKKLQVLFLPYHKTEGKQPHW